MADLAKMAAGAKEIKRPAPRPTADMKKIKHQVPPAPRLQMAQWSKQLRERLPRKQLAVTHLAPDVTTQKILVFTSPPGGALDPVGALKDSFPLDGLTTYATATDTGGQDLKLNTDITFSTPGTSHGLLTSPDVGTAEFKVATGGAGTYAYDFQVVVGPPPTLAAPAALPFTTAIFALALNGTVLSRTQEAINFDTDGYAFLTGSGQVDLTASGTVTLRNLTVRNYTTDPLRTPSDVDIPNPARLSLRWLGNLPQA